MLLINCFSMQKKSCAIVIGLLIAAAVVTDAGHAHRRKDQRRSHSRRHHHSSSSSESGSNEWRHRREGGKLDTADAKKNEAIHKIEDKVEKGRKEMEELVKKRLLEKFGPRILEVSNQHGRGFMNTFWETASSAANIAYEKATYVALGVADLGAVAAIRTVDLLEKAPLVGGYVTSAKEAAVNAAIDAALNGDFNDLFLGGDEPTAETDTTTTTTSPPPAPIKTDVNI